MEKVNGYTLNNLVAIAMAFTRHTGYTYRNLLPQELQVLLAVSQACLSSSQFLGKHSLGLVQRVREHDIRAEPEVNFFHILWRNRGTRIQGIIQFEIGFKIGIRAGLRSVKKKKSAFSIT